MSPVRWSRFEVGMESSPARSLKAQRLESTLAWLDKLEFPGSVLSSKSLHLNYRTVALMGPSKNAITSRESFCTLIKKNRNLGIMSP